MGETAADLKNDYSGLIETTLAAVYIYSKPFSKLTAQPLYVTGGAAASREIIRRISAIWDRPVIRLENMDASTGAAVAGVCAFFKSEGLEFETEQFSFDLLKKGAQFSRIAGDVALFHRPGGFLDSFVLEEQKLLTEYALK